MGGLQLRAVRDCSGCSGSEQAAASALRGFAGVIPGGEKMKFGRDTREGHDQHTEFNWLPSFCSTPVVEAKILRGQGPSIFVPQLF